MRVGTTVAFLGGMLISSASVRAEPTLAWTGDQTSLAGRFLASGGLNLEFDARRTADGSIDIVVTHNFAEVAAGISDGIHPIVALAGVRADEAMRQPELVRQVRALLDSPLWEAYLELVRELRWRIGREQPDHANLLPILSHVIEWGDRFRTTAEHAVNDQRAALPRIPRK